MTDSETDPHGRGTEAVDDPRLEQIVLAREPVVRIGPLTVEPAHRRISHDDGREDFLEPRVMQVFATMIRNQGTVLTRDDLLQSCWEGRIVGEDAITRVVSRLRRISRGIGAGVFRIETITKVGYRLLVEQGAVPPIRKAHAVLLPSALVLGVVIMLLLVTLAAVSA